MIYPTRYKQHEFSDGFLGHGGRTVEARNGLGGLTYIGSGFDFPSEDSKVDSLQLALDELAEKDTRSGLGSTAIHLAAKFGVNVGVLTTDPVETHRELVEEMGRSNALHPSHGFVGLNIVLGRRQELFQGTPDIAQSMYFNALNKLRNEYAHYIGWPDDVEGSDFVVAVSGISVITHTLDAVTNAHGQEFLDFVRNCEGYAGIRTADADIVRPDVPQWKPATEY